MDEGICCAFNILHPSYLYKGKSVIPYLVIPKGLNLLKIFIYCSDIYLYVISLPLLAPYL